MEKNKKKYGLLVAVALCVCLLGGFLANLAQTDFADRSFEYTIVPFAID